VTLLSPNSPCPPNIPPETFEALRSYVLYHRKPGGFLIAVLSNDLMDATLRGNPESLQALCGIAGFIYSNCPAACWGSKNAVEQWLEMPSVSARQIH